jgi:RNA polymerase sigma-70 factor (ECF subfamily)
MTTTVDHPAGSKSPRPSRDPELTRNAAGTDDLVREGLPRAYAGFHTFTEGTDLRAWCFAL